MGGRVRRLVAAGLGARSEACVATQAHTLECSATPRLCAAPASCPSRRCLWSSRATRPTPRPCCSIPCSPGEGDCCWGMSAPGLPCLTTAEEEQVPYGVPAVPICLPACRSPRLTLRACIPSHPCPPQVGRQRAPRLYECGPCRGGPHCVPARCAERLPAQQHPAAGGGNHPLLAHQGAGDWAGGQGALRPRGMATILQPRRE